MNHIIETIGSWGVKTSPLQSRVLKPRPGDWIKFSSPYKYPVSHEYCRIVHVNSKEKESPLISVVDGSGSAFLFEDGHISVSGGPFFSMPQWEIVSTGELHVGTFWNWGDHSPGARQGVYYNIQRPVFLAKCWPYDYKSVIAKSEKDAINGNNNFREVLPTHAKLVKTVEHDTKNLEYMFIFDIREPVEKMT